MTNKQDYSKNCVYFKYKRWNRIPKSVVNSAIEEILFVAKQEFKKPLKDWVVLDVGCGTGEYSLALEKLVKKVIGVEPYKPLYDTAIKNKKNKRSKAKFVNLTIEDFRERERERDFILSLA